MLNESSNSAYLRNFIIKSIIQFFSDFDEVVTSRYVLYFDSKENIIEFDVALRNYLSDSNKVSNLKAMLGNTSLDVSVLENYEFKNDDGAVEYEATQLQIASGSMERIIVFIPDFDKDGTLLGDAFKNNIRNKFVDDHEDKILFYLSLQNIASLSKTTENFQRQGMPLSVRKVYEYLRSQIPLVPGSNQQEVLYYSLERIMNNKPQNDTSLLDFAPFLRIIDQQFLQTSDFHDLHMFSMSLSDLGKKNINLEENYKLFRSVSLALHDQELESTMSSFEQKIIKDIEKKYDADEEGWDKNFTYEGIVKYKKSFSKKFKLELPILLLDSCDMEVGRDYYIDFINSRYASFIVFTKDYINDKKFKILLRFSQKATVSDTSDFVVEQTNSRGTAYRILLDRTEPYYQGKVTFTGGKKTAFTVYVSVMCAPIGFLADTCTGMKEEKGGYVYQLESKDYRVILGAEGAPVTINIEKLGNSAISYPINTSNLTQINFNHSDDEVVKEYSLKLDLDEDAAQILARVKFTEEKLRLVKMYELFNRCFVGHNSFAVDNEKVYNCNRKSEKYETSEFDVSGNKYRLMDLFLLESFIIHNKTLNCYTTNLKFAQTADLNIPNDVLSAVSDICDYYINVGTIPSLSCINDELKKLYEQYIDVVLLHIGRSSSEFVDKGSISTEILNILKIGLVVDSDNLIWLSPLNPLSIAYQLELSKDNTRLVELDDYLHNSLGFGNALPFLEADTGSIYQSINGSFPLQWACYCDVSQAIKGEESTFANKIQDYLSKFGYLFNDDSNTKIIINVVKIQHTFELIKALLKLYKSNALISRVSFEINYYFSGVGRNDFDQMCDRAYAEKMAASYYGVKNTDQVEGFCDWYSDNVFYYAMQDRNNYKYAHISFCGMQSDTNKNLHNTITSAESGVMLEGLISDVPSYLDTESGIYKYGYGSQYAGDVLPNSRFLELADSLNELAKCKEGSTATRNLSIAQGVQNTRSVQLENIYKASNWVVFVEPKIDLDFFIAQDNAKNDELIIIHYPDKNVSSSGYSSITVTQKSSQYIDVISDIMQKEIPMYKGQMDVKRIICDFNAYSGEWLMNFINQKQLEEKVSLVSAINFCREYFNRIYTDYTWIPVALDEILRVTGSIGGTLTNVLFSKKVLINRGIIASQNATSDDLLMAGVRYDNDRVYVTYIPIEVKHGKCDHTIKNHAHQQVINTADLLMKSFVDDINDGRKSIDKKLYRNYMIQHVISNVEKMLAYKIVADDTYKDIIASKIRVCLMNDLYTLELDKDTDKYAFYFVEGASSTERQRNNHDDVIEISTSLNHMYEFLVDNALVQSEATALSGCEEKVDATEYDISVPDEVDEDDFDTSEDIDSGASGGPERIDPILPAMDDSSDEAISNEVEDSTVIGTDAKENGSIEKTRGMCILLGEDDRTSEPVYWYPNDTSQLFHTNTGIIGTMGTGKTQFTKSLITQLYQDQKSNVGNGDIGILIFDYKGDYNESKADFVKATNATVLKPYHLPFNPLALTQSKVFKPLLPVHTANSFKDTLSRIFFLGAKQQDTLLQCINDTYEEYGIRAADVNTWNNTAPTFEQVYKRYYNDDEIKKTDSLAAAMNKIHQFQLFESDPLNTKGLFELLSGVVVIDLSGYDSDIQSFIVAITLDLFYAQMQAAGSSKLDNGLRQLTKMILVDEADNFMSVGFPSLKKILKEGREFGVGTILSTQFLKHFGNGDDDYSKYILTWIVHNVSDLKSSDVDFVFNTEAKSKDSLMLYNQIKELKIHHSIIKIGTRRPIYLHDKPFWQLYQELNLQSND